MLGGMRAPNQWDLAFELGLCLLTSCVAILSLSSPPAIKDNSTHLLDFC